MILSMSMIMSMTMTMTIFRSMIISSSRKLPSIQSSHSLSDEAIIGNLKISQMGTATS